MSLSTAIFIFLSTWLLINALQCTHITDYKDLTRLLQNSGTEGQLHPVQLPKNLTTISTERLNYKVDKVQ